MKNPNAIAEEAKPFLFDAAKIVGFLLCPTKCGNLGMLCPWLVQKCVIFAIKFKINALYILVGFFIYR